MHDLCTTGQDLLHDCQPGMDRIVGQEPYVEMIGTR